MDYWGLLITTRSALLTALYQRPLYFYPPANWDSQTRSFLTKTTMVLVLVPLRIPRTVVPFREQSCVYTVYTAFWNQRTSKEITSIPTEGYYCTSVVNSGTKMACWWPASVWAVIPDVCLYPEQSTDQLLEIKRRGRGFPSRPLGGSIITSSYPINRKTPLLKNLLFFGLRWEHA